MHGSNRKQPCIYAFDRKHPGPFYVSTMHACLDSTSAAPQVSDKPALNHDAFSGLERLKDRVAADGKAPSAEASAANQPIEASEYISSLIDRFL